jgi:hypothetical protein
VSHSVWPSADRHFDKIYGLRRHRLSQLTNNSPEVVNINQSHDLVDLLSLRRQNRESTTEFDEDSFQEFAHGENDSSKKHDITRADTQRSSKHRSAKSSRNAIRPLSFIWTKPHGPRHPATNDHRCNGQQDVSVHFKSTDAEGHPTLIATICAADDSLIAKCRSSGSVRCLL